MGGVSLALLAGCSLAAAGWRSGWGGWAGGAATTGPGLASVPLWFWIARQFLWAQSCYRSSRTELSDRSQRESLEGASALCCGDYSVNFIAQETGSEIEWQNKGHWK